MHQTYATKNSRNNKMQLSLCDRAYPHSNHTWQINLVIKWKAPEQRKGEFGEKMEEGSRAGETPWGDDNDDDDGDDDDGDDNDDDDDDDDDDDGEDDAGHDWKQFGCDRLLLL